MTPLQTKREMQAEREVGHTSVRRPVAATLSLFFLLVVTMPLLWESTDHQMQVAPGSFHPLTEVAHLAPRGDEIRRVLSGDGGLAEVVALNRGTRERLEAFETGLRQRSPIGAHLLPPLNRLLSGSLGASNGNVIPGVDGWLFFEPAVRHVIGPPFLAPRNLADRASDPLAALRQFHEQLAGRGITLVVLPVPGKASIYPEQLADGADGSIARQNDSHHVFLAQLREEGIQVWDPTEVLMDAKAHGATYLRHDSHWTPHGMKHVANWVVSRMEAEDLLSESRAGAYREGPKMSVSYPGDLAQMLYSGTDRPPESAEAVLVQPVVEQDGTPWAPDRASEILLLGDSFANIYSAGDLGWGHHAGLAEQLSLGLQRPVDRITQNDHGAFASRLGLSEALAQGDDRLQSTRIVLYEFAARELSRGDWKVGLSLDVGIEERAAHGLRTVRGRIVERSLPAAPGSAPYKDCIVSILLAPSTGPGEDNEPVVIRAWGMREHRWTAVTGWQPGDEITVQLRPWGADNALETVNRVPLTGAFAASGPVWWLDQDTGYAEPADDRSAVHSEPLPEDAGLSGLVQRLEAQHQSVWHGTDGWLFFTPELRSMAVGPFWGAQAPTVSRAANPAQADPLPAILDFHRQLEAAGIKLILMPVPPKAGIYPDKVSGSLTAQDLEEKMAKGGALSTFLGQLTDAGINVIDLRTRFGAQPSPPDEPYYCRTDTHWSSRGLAIAADAVAEQLQGFTPLETWPTRSYATRSVEISIQGDLAALGGIDLADEVVSVTQVGTLESGNFAPVSPDRESPIVLLGDSHNLVFHAGGDMHASAGGLPDLLALRLGFPVDLVAVRGSGATAPRINLARRQDQLAGKNVVLWCFSAREFTESTTGWRIVPVIP